MLIAGAAALLAAGCTAASTSDSTSTAMSTSMSASASTDKTTTSLPGVGRRQPGVDPGHIVAAPSTSTTTPVEDPAKPVPIGPQSAVGQQVVITKAAFVPQQLNALEGKSVVWTNESGTPQVVSILGLGVRSPEIPPGAQFVWTPPAGGTLNVRSDSGSAGSLVVSTGQF
jgi:hypothetical protein